MGSAPVMFQLVFSKAAFLFYLFVILTELATRHGIRQAALQGRSTAFPLADVCGLFIISFMLYYSYHTAWYSFLLLLAVYLAIFIIMRRLLTVVITNKKQFSLFTKSARFLLVPVVILMFFLVKN